ncbi:hypothetical protein CPB83DRAFT_899709 [Crepidotus variabilis]|uniref:Uncharacterized protein n=1 Tax=Crepidotus variabilis TaxID=179855 RepID=A0A9P6E4H6_9AGAR|nr:hypothetical protein CPB83DRAFT_899709 [Crepidotus variabilis]
MPQRPSIDDTNTTLIQYTGDWQYLEGSTRQWQGGVHATGQEGATATFSFHGYQVWVRGTVPAGSGSNLIDVTLDGNTTSTSRLSNVSAVYDEIYYTSAVLPNTFHTIIITNRGSEQNGHTEFLFDRLEFDTDDEVPMFAPPSSSTLAGQSTASSSGQWPTASSPQTFQAKKAPVGGIVGGVIGALAVCIGAILLFVFLRKRRTRNQTQGRQPGPSTTQETTLITPYSIISTEPGITMSGKETHSLSDTPILPNTEYSSANATIISSQNRQSRSGSQEISGLSPLSREENLVNSPSQLPRDSVHSHVHGPPPSYEVNPTTTR